MLVLEVVSRINLKRAMFHFGGNYAFRRRSVSELTAKAMTTPIITCWMNGETPVRFSPLCKTPMIKTPTTVPAIPPTPPLKLAPPITTAAIASSS